MTPGRKIVAEVAALHGVSVREITAPAYSEGVRVAAVVRARQHAMAEMRTRLGYSLPQIGRVMGGRHHTTIMHGIRRWQEGAGA